MLRRLWHEWLILARHIGSFQARVLITLVYFTLILPFGLLVRLLSDPLRRKAGQGNTMWQARATYDLDLERARRQG
ncbi:MAG: hypothetical protein RMN24_06660 [Anaerolineae bacterium]|nr:hypothetical protein [Caldilineales bacterium]MCX7853478.1 hypothetical protein [Caldilineales bacterium]MDW8268836.1 hypothetical protein [Anaerolineae bacterium]